MLVTIKGTKGNLGFLESGKITEKNYSQFENRIAEIINIWHSPEISFSFQTSGSTGEQKIVNISKEVLEYSARQTLNKLDPDNQFKESLICINPNYIGGTMAVIRAIIGRHNLTIMEPEANPLSQIGQSQFDLVSMVPLQIQTTLEENPEQFSRVKTVIIGGAALNDQVLTQLRQAQHTRFFHSYGMTETASHFALKDLNSETQFEILGDANIETDEIGRLKVRGTVTNNEWLQTTDLVEIVDRQHFNWIGRADNVINTGGFKVSAETIESILNDQISDPFFIAGIEDEKLGQRIVLIIESNEKITYNNLNFGDLNKYAIPKETIFIESFAYTDTGKINRTLTLQKANREY